MEVVDSRQRRVLAEARRFVRGEALAFVFYLVLVGLLAWLAVGGVFDRFGVPAAALWLLVGVAAGDVWGAARSVASGWRELWRLRRNPAYVAAVADLDEAHQRAQRAAGGGR